MNNRKKYLQNISKQEKNIRDAIRESRLRILKQRKKGKPASDKSILKEKWLIKNLKKLIPKKYPDYILRPCPFCGNKKIIIAEKEKNIFYAKCTDCKASGGQISSPIEAIRLWNQRNLKAI